MNKFKNIIVENCPYNSYFCSYDSKWNYVDEDGNLLSPINFDWAFPFNEQLQLGCVKKYVETQLDGCKTRHFVKNYITEEGKLLLNEWVNDNGYAFNKYGYCFVENHDCFNVVDSKGNFISDVWAYNCYFSDFDENIIALYFGKKGYKILNLKTGKFISNTFFKTIEYANPLVVYSNKKWNMLKKNGTFVFDSGFENIVSLKQNIYVVKQDKKWHLIDLRNGKNFISDVIFDVFDIFDRKNVLSVFIKDKGWNLYDLKTNTLKYPTFYFDKIQMDREGQILCSIIE